MRCDTIPPAADNGRDCIDQDQAYSGDLRKPVRLLAKTRIPADELIEMLKSDGAQGNKRDQEAEAEQRETNTAEALAQAVYGYRHDQGADAKKRENKGKLNCATVVIPPLELSYAAPCCRQGRLQVKLLVHAEQKQEYRQHGPKSLVPKAHPSDNEAGK